ncbi:MAG: hypothetical protein KatS3mg095_0042 [Candidatus Parcubacteria bacterium]|nr:MAG: hypothetical protein KatS3mg095_0042 [Candidatus Parcubacteria bacterium]
MFIQLNYPFNPNFGLPSQQNVPVPLVCDDVLPCLLLLFRWLFSILIWLSLAFSVIMIVITGLRIIMQPQDFKGLGKNLVWILLGLIIALVSYSLVLLIERVASTGSIN